MGANENESLKSRLSLNKIDINDETTFISKPYRSSSSELPIDLLEFR